MTPLQRALCHALAERSTRDEMSLPQLRAAAGAHATGPYRQISDAVEDLRRTGHVHRNRVASEHRRRAYSLTERGRAFAAADPDPR